MTGTSPPRTFLGASQRERYAREGFLILEGAIGEEELAELRSEAERVLHLVLGSSTRAGQRNPRLDVRHLGAGRTMVRKVQPVNDLSESIRDLSSDPRLVGPMSELMGDEPVLMEEKLNYKQVVQLDEADAEVLERGQHMESLDDAWLLHHDWGYYRANGYPQSTMSSAIALDDCEGRGPIRVVPGSHLLDASLADPQSGSGVLAPDALGPEPNLIHLDLVAGSVVLFHSKLVHDSLPNRSGMPRRLMIYSHYPRSHDPAGDPDRRNRPTRERARQMESGYRAVRPTKPAPDAEQGGRR